LINKREVKMAEYGSMKEEEEDYLEEEDTQKDKFLTFRLANEDYGIEICYVTEIIGIQKITEIPDMPDFVRGVINLRGKVIPVIDVRTRFKLQPMAYGDRTCIVVVDIDQSVIGLIVDEVSEVLGIPAANIDPAPKTGKGTKSRFIQGIGKVGEQVKIILHVGQLLNDEELAGIKEIG
jgi:purine-binding chemotaxis protein CheW